MFDDIQMFARYLAGLRGFLNEPLSSERARRIIGAQIAAREAIFLRLVEKGVYGNAASPYRKLLLHAGIELGDLARGISRDGLKTTLERLYRAGVYASYEEFKCRRPIQRGSLTITPEPREFDNPLLVRHYQGTSGGSRGVGTRVAVDLDLLAYEAAHYDLFEGGLGIAARPIAVWRPVPPAVSGLRVILKLAKLGWAVEKWYSQNAFRPSLRTAEYFLFCAATVHASRILRRPLPRPEFVPLAHARIVARWLAQKKAQHSPAALFTQTSSAVRVCRSALDEGIDISASVFIVGGEPYTAAKARVVAAAGCTAAPYYAMAEIGTVAEPCATPAAVDDVHLLEDKIAVLQKSIAVSESAQSVDAFFYTTLLPSTPKIMINTATGDYGIVERRECGCPAAAIGLCAHLSHVRSYDKLTSEGVAFIGSDLMDLLETALPRRFGGYPQDYQLVEEERNGLSTVQIRVSPAVGAVDENEVIDTVLQALATRRGAAQMMAERWRQAGTLQVVRGEPFATFGGKIMPLHFRRGECAQPSEK